MKVSLHDVALERAYIATLLCGAAEQHLASASRLDPHDCYGLDHDRILSMLYEVAARGEEVSTLCVRVALERASVKISLDAFDTLGAASLTLEPLALIAERLGSLASLRRARQHLMRAVDAVQRLHLEDAQECARAALDETPSSRVVPLSAHAIALMAAHESRSNAGKQLRMLRSGFALMDAAMRGVPQRTMMILGGRTGAGKSTLMLAIALDAARKGNTVGIVSLEDSETIWGGRVLSHLCNVSPEQLMDQQLDFNVAAELERGLDRAKELGVQFTYALNRPLDDVLAAIRSLVANGCDAIIVDYLQAIRLGTDGKRAELVSAAAQRIKSECQMLGVPLILGSQLSRPDRSKPFAEPHAGDLKESGDLENMAEVIVLLWKSSDDEDARLLGKLAKVKWSFKRPRFELLLDPQTGALRSLIKPREQEQSSASEQPGKRWS